MRLTVLGSGASFPGAGRACAGYLVRDGSTTVLLDCGNGSIPNLARLMRPEDLGAAFVTHAHPDHFADLYVLQAALRYAPDGPAPAVELFCPARVREAVLAPLSGRGRAEMLEAFAVHGVEHGRPVSVDALVITPWRTSHSKEAYALDVRGPDGRLFYTSDSALTEELVDCATGADLLVAEATLPEAYAGRAPHMTPREAGVLARRADVQTLVLTHLWPSIDREAAAADAAQEFDGRIMVADEMLSIDLGEED